MPTPSRKDNENKSKFMSRCMSDETMKTDYKNIDQRTAICMAKATDSCDKIEAADFEYNVKNFGYEEEINEENFYIPTEAEYVDFGEEVEEWDVATAKPGLWENIRKKKEREGKKYKPAKKGDPDRPDPESWKKAQSNNDDAMASEYQGRKVQLNKPFRTPDGPKKMSVYVKNETSNVIKVNFGDPNMKNRSDDPKRKKAFRSRHNCDNPGPKYKARYWSCRAW